MHDITRARAERLPDFERPESKSGPIATRALCLWSVALCFGLTWPGARLALMHEVAVAW